MMSWITIEKSTYAMLRPMHSLQGRVLRSPNVAEARYAENI